MSFNYFNKLNYTLANEDTSLEMGILEARMKNIATVAGSGSRALPLAFKAPERLTCIDLSEAQLHLTELRVQSCRELTHEQYLSFWGYPPKVDEPKARKRVFDSLALSQRAKDALRATFELYEWRPILYEGKWEKTFRKIATLTHLLVGKKGEEIFKCSDLESQRAFYREHFPKRAWDLSTWLIGNGTFFNALLYKGHFPEKNISGSHYTFYKNAFRTLFQDSLARENYFLQLLVFGQVKYPEGNPIECQPSVYPVLKDNLKRCEVSYIQANILDWVEKQEASIDFLSFSDVPSYFSGIVEKEFLARSAKGLAPRGHAVVRSYLHVPQATVPFELESRTSEFSSLLHKEKTQMYHVAIWRKK